MPGLVGKRHKTKYISFQRNIVVVGTQKNYVHILQRNLSETKINDIDSTESFTEIWACFSKLETSSGTERFDGVNTADGVTHKCTIPYYQRIFELDLNTLFILKNDPKPRYFKLLSIENIGGQDQYILLNLKETGFSSKVAATS